MTPDRFHSLITNFKLRQLSSAESEELRMLVQESDDEEWLQLLDRMMQQNELENNHLDKAFLSNELAVILSVDKPGPSDYPGMDTGTVSINRGAFLRRWWVAASLILVLGASIAIGIRISSADRSAVTVNRNGLAEEIVAGKEGAVLTLSDGSQIVLDSLGAGVVATQNGSRVLLKNGGLAYTSTGDESGEQVFNTMATPKGRQFNLVLADGTKVWLNSASSLRFPTNFSGNIRQVEVQGEAYFEVAKNEKMPFRVSIINRLNVEVLGTHFNIKAYNEERAISTTLLEGAVAIDVNDGAGTAGTKSSAILKPGEQAQVAFLPGLAGKSVSAKHEKAELKIVKDVDVEKVMAWKNGLFNFDGAHLEEVMRQLERWYDIEVVYEKGVPDITFGGQITKDVSLNDLLVGLKQAELNFRIEGRKLIVLP